MSRKWILPCVDAHDVGRTVLVLQARRMFVNEFCHWYSFNSDFSFRAGCVRRYRRKNAMAREHRRWHMPSASGAALAGNAVTRCI